MKPVKPSIAEINEAVVKAIREAQAAGIAPEHVSSVASTLATLELLGFDNGDTALSVDVPIAIAFRETFAEWVQQYDIKTHFDRFLAATFYLMKHEGKQTFTTTDIGRMYERAYWKRPANMADVFAKGAQRLYFAPEEGYTDESEEGLKMWRMTSTGYNYLQSLKKEG